jgi:hypothetical protein
MILKENERYVTRKLQIINIVRSSSDYVYGHAIEFKNINQKLTYKYDGKSVDKTTIDRNIIEEITAKQSNHGIYSDFELSIIRAEDKIRTCTIHGVHAHMQLKIKEKKNRLNNCLRILQYL